jgi:hypothetical protein
MSFEVKDLDLTCRRVQIQIFKWMEDCIWMEKKYVQTPTLGGAANALVIGGGNIQNTVVGKYTM